MTEGRRGRSNFWQTKRWDTDYETPADGWDALMMNIVRPTNRRVRVWDPFFCEGLSRQMLEQRGCQVIHEDRDFYAWQPDPSEYDVILTNPPYSQKKKVLERMLELSKPFALIVPISILASKYFAKLLPGQNIPYQVIVPERRITFVRHGQPTSVSPFDSIWLCVRMEAWLRYPEKQLVFNGLKSHPG